MLRWAVPRLAGPSAGGRRRGRLARAEFEAMKEGCECLLSTGVYLALCTYCASGKMNIKLELQSKSFKIY